MTPLGEMAAGGPREKGKEKRCLRRGKMGNLGRMGSLKLANHKSQF